MKQRLLLRLFRQASLVKSRLKGILSVNQWLRFEEKKLTGDVVVDVPLELQAHVVGAELLEFDSELDVLLRLVAVDQDVGIEDCTAALCLLPLHQVQLVELIFSALVCFGTDDVQFVPDVRVDHQALSSHKPGGRKNR